MLFVIVAVIYLMRVWFCIMVYQGNGKELTGYGFLSARKCFQYAGVIDRIDSRMYEAMLDSILSKFRNFTTMFRSYLY